MTKTCPKCSIAKPLGSFYPDKTRGTVRPVCKECTSEEGRAWRAANKERKAASDKKNREENIERRRATSLTYYYANKHKYVEATARRKAAKLRATPTWLTKEQLEEIAYIYELRKDASLLSDTEYHVDHIVPLQGKNVCGLHVPWNLQLLSKEENLAKNNRH